MSEMTPEAASALRRAFPATSIGKLPKGGIMIDYVGHAATTDRLLSVDPLWTWEPLGVDAQGLPAIDAAGNLWIRLTVCGVTRIGVGDGKNMKERIGDAIRNAAMRFGVALDLWSKEELESADHGTPESVQRRPAPSVPAADPAGLEADDGRPLTAKTRAHMFALFAEAGIADADAQRRGMAAVLGHQVESRGGITESEGQRVVQSLASRKDHRS